MPRLRIVLFSPAHDAIEFIGRAMPGVQPEPKFADPAPLMQPVAVNVSSARPPQRRLLVAAGAGLVAVAALVGVAAFGLPLRLPTRSRTPARAPIGGAV